MDISYGNWNIYNKEGYLTSWYETSLTRLHTLIGIGNAWRVTDPIWRQGVNTFAAHVWDPSRHVPLWYECNIDSYIWNKNQKILKDNLYQSVLFYYKPCLLLTTLYNFTIKFKKKICITSKKIKKEYHKYKDIITKID